jgi:capsule polysaccharide export protein KpsE/RkpR
MSEKITSSYVELGSQAYSVAADAIASANYRLLDYWKSVWDITSKPYTSTAIDATVRENFDRANAILNLTVEELQAQEKKAQELAEKVVEQGAKLQDSTISAFRGVLNTSISNLNYVKDSTTERLEELKKRLGEVRPGAPSGG